MNKSKKSGCLKTIIIFILIAGLIAGVLGYFTGGFKDWSFINKPSVPPAEEAKEIVSTTIYNENYGTFILPKNHIKSCYGYILPNGTKLKYFNEQENANVIAYFDDDAQNYFNVTEISDSLDNYGIKLFTFDNDEFRYTYSGDVSQVLGQFHLLLSSGSEDNIDIEEFNMNVYVEEYKFYNSSYSKVVISDTGVPLTESIYNEIMLDNNTKITYTYAD